MHPPTLRACTLAINVTNIPYRILHEGQLAVALVLKVQQLPQRRKRQILVVLQAESLSFSSHYYLGDCMHMYT